MFRRITGAMLALALAACSRQPAPTSPQVQGPAAQNPAPPAKPAEPSDAHLAQLYDSSCRACHGQRGTGAPETGDAVAWAPRRAKGMPALMDSVVKGKNAMPAGGQCFSCTPKDYEALIHFMSGHEGETS